MAYARRAGTAKGGSGTAKGGSGTAAAARVQAQLDAARDRALDRIGRRAVAHARANCPVKTGALRASIAYEVKDGVLRVGSKLPYAAKVEREQPFLRPAMANHTEEYRRIARAAFRG